MSAGQEVELKGLRKAKAHIYVTVTVSAIKYDIPGVQTHRLHQWAGSFSKGKNMPEDVTLEVGVKLVVDHGRLAIDSHPLFKSGFLVRVGGMEVVSPGHHDEVAIHFVLSQEP